MTLDEYATAWINRPTERQLQYIQELQEFSDYPLPPFTGTTKQEASDYIALWSSIAHEDPRRDDYLHF